MSRECREELVIIIMEWRAKAVKKRGGGGEGGSGGGGWAGKCILWDVCVVRWGEGAF